MKIIACIKEDGNALIIIILMNEIQVVLLTEQSPIEIAIERPWRGEKARAPLVPGAWRDCGEKRGPGPRLPSAGVSPER